MLWRCCGVNEKWALTINRGWHAAVWPLTTLNTRPWSRPGRRWFQASYWIFGNGEHGRNNYWWQKWSCVLAATRRVNYDMPTCNPSSFDHWNNIDEGETEMKHFSNNHVWVNIYQLDNWTFAVCLAWWNDRKCHVARLSGPINNEATWWMRSLVRHMAQILHCEQSISLTK